MENWSKVMENILVVIRISIFIMFLVGGVTYIRKKYIESENKLYFCLVVLIIISIIAFPLIMNNITGSVTT